MAQKRYENYLEVMLIGMVFMIAGLASIWLSSASLTFGGGCVALYGLIQAFRYAPR